MPALSTFFRTGRATLLVIGALLVSAVTFFYFLRPPSAEERQFRLRYTELVADLHSGDPTRAGAVLSPDVQPTDNVNYGRLINFARPLQADSEVSIHGDTASVTPEPQKHYLIIPGGHTVHLRKTRGEWFFTGKINID